MTMHFSRPLLQPEKVDADHVYEMVEPPIYLDEMELRTSS